MTVDDRAAIPRRKFKPNEGEEMTYIKVSAVDRGAASSRIRVNAYCVDHMDSENSRCWTTADQVQFDLFPAEAIEHIKGIAGRPCSGDRLREADDSRACP
jgi:hypothetical protein